MIFSFCWWFSLLCKILKAWLGPICLLLLLFLLPCETDLRKHCYYLWQRMAYLCFILGIFLVSCLISGFPGGSDGKASACSDGSPDSIPGSGRSPGEGNGYPLQHSCLENPMDRGAWSMESQRVGHNWATSLNPFRGVVWYDLCNIAFNTKARFMWYIGVSSYHEFM